MIEQINKELEKHNNVLLYNKYLYRYYKKHENDLNAIYISTPKKEKTAFEAMLKRADRKAIVKNKTISKLIEQIK